ncbi:hypothetical protein K435DRAFT_853817 [Dendrothele bispora CBS 962.96]|uniref:Uncharacterized protein n=1 Tax=Dendrothele bispora (strain CBS 962.96) TaxID=1314807 RepID=A0A4S8MFJ1_DENBC|nr:hypothetical protein K435DRAFT_853817 [Dendrothele bispora CBS 962.96]
MSFDALFTSDLVPARLVALYLPAIELAVYSLIADAFYTRASGAKSFLLQTTMQNRFNDLCADFQLCPTGFRRCLEENWSFVAGFHAIRCGLGAYTAAASGAPLDILVAGDNVEKMLVFLLSTGLVKASITDFHSQFPGPSPLRDQRLAISYLLPRSATLRLCDSAPQAPAFQPQYLRDDVVFRVDLVDLEREDHVRSRKFSAARFGFAPITLNGQRRYPCDECPRRPYGPRLSSRASFICYRSMEPAVSRLVSLDMSPEMFSVVCFNGDCPSDALMLQYPPTFYTSLLPSSLDQYLPWEAFWRGLTNFWPHTLRDDYVSSSSLLICAFTTLAPSDVFRGGIRPQVCLPDYWGTSIGIGSVWIVIVLLRDPAQLPRLLFLAGDFHWAHMVAL